MTALPARSDVPVHDGIAPLLSRYDGFLVDQFGVILDGSRLVSGAAEALALLRNAGKRIVVVSNSGRRAVRNARRLIGLGIPGYTFDGVVTSGEIVWAALRDRDQPPFARFGERCLLISREGDRSGVEGLPLRVVESPEEASFVLLAGLDAADDARTRIADLLDRALRFGLPLLCANPDRVSIERERRLDGPGRLAERYRDEGGDVTFVGKPQPALFEAGLALLGMPPDRAVMIGDSLHHDIAGARSVNLDGALVMGGVHRATFADATTPAALRERLAALLPNHGGQTPVALLRRFAPG